jgi:dTDP-4-dehydrorhamnose 3,5-epimerase
LGQIKFIETGLQGAFIVELSPKGDERGRFMRVYCKDEFAKIGHQKEFVQLNHSVNTIKGTVRGMHFQQEPYAETKLIRCIKGAVFDVIVDLRKNSDTYLKWFGAVITAENLKMMYVPEGFAHGFQTLEDNTELLYHHTEFYHPESEGGVNALDKKININWPKEITLLSDKDRSLPEIDKKFKAF